MTQPAPPYGSRGSTPVGHSGIRVDIHERAAWAINGWLGVLVAAACIATQLFVVRGSATVISVALLLVAAVILASLVIVQPGQTRVMRFFGSYVGTVRGMGILPVRRSGGTASRVGWRLAKPSPP